MGLRRSFVRLIRYFCTFQRGLLAAFLLLGIGHAQIVLPDPPSEMGTRLRPATDAEPSICLSFDSFQEGRGVSSQSKPYFTTESGDLDAKTPDAGSRLQSQGVLTVKGRAEVQIRNRGPPHLTVARLL